MEVFDLSYQNIRTDHLWLQSTSSSVEVHVLRLDLLHASVPGNKWFKLKYNLEKARREGHAAVLTFGGAWSNHLAATAAACRLAAIPSIGVIRGEEPAPLSHTLQKALEDGMRLHFISREEYRRKDDPLFLDSLREKFGNVFFIPEGGSNEEGTKGCEDIADLANNYNGYTHICCAVGTGTTLAGLIRRGHPHQTFLGFSALKNASYIQQEIQKKLPLRPLPCWHMIEDYHFGGFAKHDATLICFMNDFYRHHHIPLDKVYTAKMFFGITDLLQKNYFPPGSRVLAIHTGGLQGNASLPQGTLIYP